MVVLGRPLSERNFRSAVYADRNPRDFRHRLLALISHNPVAHSVEHASFLESMLDSALIAFAKRLLLCLGARRVAARCTRDPATPLRLSSNRQCPPGRQGVEIPPHVPECRIG